MSDTDITDSGEYHLSNSMDQIKKPQLYKVIEYFEDKILYVHGKSKVVGSKLR